MNLLKHDNDDLVFEARVLCSHYMWARLKKEGMTVRKESLQKISSLNVPNRDIFYVFKVLYALGNRLEANYTNLYSSVCRQVCVTLTSDKVLRNVFLNIAGELFRNEVNWGRIVSLFAVAGGLAVDCVRQGHPDYLPALIETTGAIVERDLASWIANQGGWRALLERYKAPTEGSSLESIVVAVLLLILFALSLIGILKYLGRLLIPT